MYEILDRERLEEARAQFIAWTSREGGPTPSFGAVSDVLYVLRLVTDGEASLLLNLAALRGTTEEQ